MNKFTLEQILLPEIEPITLVETKNHLRAFASVTDDDSTITDLIKGAREWVEDYTGRALMDQTWRLTIEGGYGGTIGGDMVSGFQQFPGFGAGGSGTKYEWLNAMSRGQIMLHKAPVLAIVSFKSVDDAGVETDISASTYQLREQLSKYPRIVPLNSATWPSGSLLGGLRVTFRAGFADTTGSPQQAGEVVPVRFKQAMKLWVEANYDRDPTMMPKLLETACNLVKGERAELQLA